MLTERQQQVFDILQSNPTTTLREIAQQLGVTHQRVFQLHSKLLGLGLVRKPKELRSEQLRQQKAVQRSDAAALYLKKRIGRWMILRWRMRMRAGLRRDGTIPFYVPGEHTICRYAGCSRPVDARGFCTLHYTCLRSEGVLWVRRSGRSTCGKLGCYRSVYARGMCRSHYNYFRRLNPVKNATNANNTSGYRGVTFLGRYNKWAAQIGYQGKQEYLGSFSSARRAARAYDAAAREYFGNQAILNFPNENIIERAAKRAQRTPQRGSDRCIYWWEDRKMWRVVVSVDGKKKSVGTFRSKEDAVLARDTAERKG